MSAQVINVPPIAWTGRLSAAQATAYAAMLTDLASKHRSEAEVDPIDAAELRRIAETDEMLAHGFMAVSGPLRRREVRGVRPVGGRAA